MPLRQLAPNFSGLTSSFCELGQVWEVGEGLESFQRILFRFCQTTFYYIKKATLGTRFCKICSDQLLNFLKLNMHNHCKVFNEQNSSIQTFICKIDYCRTGNLKPSTKFSCTDFSRGGMWETNANEYKT